MGRFVPMAESIRILFVDSSFSIYSTSTLSRTTICADSWTELANDFKNGYPLAASEALTSTFIPNSNNLIPSLKEPFIYFTTIPISLRDFMKR
jgi:hypothetical protein